MDRIATIEQRAQAVLGCQVPETLHPLSASALDAFLRDELPVAAFARLFPMANSSYISVTDCILAFIEITKPALAAL